MASPGMILLFILFILFASKQTAGTTVRMAEISLTVLGKGFVDNLVFTSNEQSDVSCAYHCAASSDCVTFTFSKESKICRGHAQFTTGPPQSFDIPDSVGFVVVKITTLTTTNQTTMRTADPETQPTVSTIAVVTSVATESTAVPETEDWFGTACTTDATCTEPYAGCYGDLCVCTPGYYYSRSLKTCVPTCMNLLSEFVTYPEFDVTHGDICDVVVSSHEQCKSACLSLSVCVTATVYNGKCYYKSHTALISPDYAGYAAQMTHFQRMCA